MKINNLQNSLNLIPVDRSSLNASGKITSKPNELKPEIVDKLSLTGSDLNSVKENGKIYDKHAVKSAALAPLASKPHELEDFSLDPNSSIKAENISQIRESEQINASAPKTVITDEQMDDFLHKAFKMFDLDY